MIAKRKAEQERRCYLEALACLARKRPKDISALRKVVEEMYRLSYQANKRGKP